MGIRCVRWLWILLLMAGVSWGSTTAVAAQSTAVSIADYWQILQATQAEVRRLEDTPLAARSGALEAMTARLEGITAVTLPDGRTIPVHSTFLIQELHAPDPDLARIEALLATQLTTWANWPDSQLNTLDEAALAKIMARPEFHYETPEPTALQRLWQDIRRRFIEFLADLLPKGDANVPLSDVITFFSVVVLVLLLGYGLRGLLASFAADASLSPGDDLAGEVLTADTALQRAQQLSMGGDYRAAVRYLYLSSLLLLEERDLLRYDRSMTNREYVHSVQRHPRLAAILQDVIEVFDRVWYGFQTLEADEYEKYARQVEALKHQREGK